MRFVTTLALLLLAFSVAGAADEPAKTPFDEVPVISLDSAARSGVVRGGGEKPRSYSGVTLVLSNRTGERQAIDVAGGFLRPKTRGSCQRLGLGPARRPELTSRRGPGSIIVNLEPGETRRIEMNTVCLDSGRPAPSKHAFDLAQEKLPPVRRKVMRWWADHPETPQYAVNSAIWQNCEKVVVPATTNGNRRPPVLGRPASHAGTVYRLLGHELLSRDPDGLIRFIGTGIEQVFPTGNGVFAVAPGARCAREVWRLALTGDNPWTRVAGLEQGVEVRDVFAVGKSVIIVRSDGIDFVRDGETRRVITSGSDYGYPFISAWPVAGRRVRIVYETTGAGISKIGGERKNGRSKTIVVEDLDPVTGTVRRLRENWNLRSVAVGPSGTWALSHGANLRRLNGKSFKAFGPNLPWRRILAVGNKYLWVQDRQENTALLSARTGSVVKRFQIQLGADSFTIDRATDDLIYGRADTMKRIEAATGKVTKVEFESE